ncbi:MAG TPA: alpha-glucan family phosphorylase [Patescibacteria group bacterium]|nr:alpha-glucan family phosphorylase [Patescibacteria group bacterium]
MENSAPNKPVAFLCAEFGIDNDLPTYSGGLGILSADIIQEAADQDFPMVGVGLLYKGRWFMQHITGTGNEEKRDTEFDHDTSFLRPTYKNGKPLKLTLEFGGDKIYVKPYQIRLSEKVTLYFLSTDVDGNPQQWISDMDALYHGDEESQVRQMLILGIGGVKLLNELNIKPSVYHINEGRPTMCVLEITKNILSENEKLSFTESWNIAKSKIVYTNHTLVSAGNPLYPIELFEKYTSGYSKLFNVEGGGLLSMGKVANNKFDITKFALSVSIRHNSVSKLHESYAKKQWPDFEWVNITNGVHMGRWQDSDFRNTQLSDEQIWDLHIIKKHELAETVIKRTGIGYDPNKLVVTWARRLAEYKQPMSVFQDIETLKSIITDINHPIQILFAGNSHSADPNAKSIIERIIEIFSKELFGNAIFIPNYNISLANNLVSGSDVWLNTPKGNQEASGTSGMKAIANGVLSCTVADGWVSEVDWKDIGWILDAGNPSGSLYSTLKDSIAPMFFGRDKNGLPQEWIQRMRRSINTSTNFSTTRVIEDYKKLLWKV